MFLKYLLSNFGTFQYIYIYLAKYLYTPWNQSWNTPIFPLFFRSEPLFTEKIACGMKLSTRFIFTFRHIWLYTLYDPLKVKLHFAFRTLSTQKKTKATLYPFALTNEQSIPCPQYDKIDAMFSDRSLRERGEISMVNVVKWMSRSIPESNIQNLDIRCTLLADFCSDYKLEAVPFVNPTNTNLWFPSAMLYVVFDRFTYIHIKYDFQYWPAPINNSHIAISESTVRQLSSLPLDNYEPLNHHIHNVLSLTDHQTQLYDLLTVEPVLLNPTSYIYIYIL